MLIGVFILLWVSYLCGLYHYNNDFKINGFDTDTQIKMIRDIMKY